MKKDNKEPRRLGVYLRIIGLVLVTQLLLTGVTQLVVYPTDEHRDTAHQINATMVGSWSGEVEGPVVDNPDDVFSSPEYLALENSAENRYINVASGVMLVVGLIVDIAIVFAVYHYLRRHRQSNRLVGTTVLLVMLGTFLPLLADGYISSAYLGDPMPGLGHIVFMLFIGLTIMPLTILVLTHIVQWAYNRKHSFVVE